jgi:hypothetical protein
MRPLFLVLALPFAACTLGDRAENGCPIGQTCSDQTPDGLAFEGPTLGGAFLDASVKPVAVGGTETVLVTDAATGDGIYAPFTASFSSAALRVATIGSSRVTVAGVADGDAKLRLDDADGLLLDQVTMSARVLDHVALAATEAHLDPQTTGEVVWSGGHAYLTVELMAADGTRLVDDGTAIDVPGANPDGWDSFDVTAPSGGLHAQVTAAGQSFDATLDTIDDASAATTGAEVLIHDDEGHTTGYSYQFVCFHAHVSDTVEIIAVPWQISVTGPAHVDGGIGALIGENCTSLAIDAAGSVTVTGTAPGLAPASATFAVSPPPQKQKQRAQPDRLASDGDRASMSR